MPKKTFATKAFVTDLDEAKAFYGGTLKMKLEDDGSADGYLVFAAKSGESILIELLTVDAKQAAQVEADLAALKKAAATKGKQGKGRQSKIVVDDDEKHLPAVITRKGKNLPARRKD
jgi:catechol 2,3-dioxygenase-like lactoylglutathione lyase family enzyme